MSILVIPEFKAFLIVLTASDLLIAIIGLPSILTAYGLKSDSTSAIALSKPLGIRFLCSTAAIYFFSQ
jgi:hypothetical protein